MAAPLRYVAYQSDGADCRHCIMWRAEGFLSWRVRGAFARRRGGSAPYGDVGASREAIAWSMVPLNACAAALRPIVDMELFVPTVSYYLSLFLL